MVSALKASLLTASGLSGRESEHQHCGADGQSFVLPTGAQGPPGHVPGLCMASDTHHDAPLELGRGSDTNCRFMG